MIYTSMDTPGNEGRARTTWSRKAAPKKRAAGCNSFDAKRQQKFPEQFGRKPLRQRGRFSAPKTAFDAVSSHLFTALSHQAHVGNHSDARTTARLELASFHCLAEMLDRCFGQDKVNQYRAVVYRVSAT